MATLSAIKSEFGNIDAPGFGDELVARATAMIPDLRARAEADHAAGFTSRQTFAELKAAGLTRVMQPRRYGGLQQPLEIFARAAVAISRGDQSAGWSYGITQGHAHHLNLFDVRAQDDVWGDNPGVLIASPYNPYGTAKSVPGGYEFSGSWPFSSACDHCDWFMLGAFVDGDESKFLTFLVPGSEVEIVDDWKVVGLKATGSKTVRVKGCHVPEYRTLPFGPGTESLDFPGYKVNDAPWLRIPYILVFNRLVSATSIGGLANMLDTVLEYLAPKISVITGKPVSEHPDTLLAIGEAYATFEELVTLAVHDLGALTEIGARDVIPDEATINMFRYRAQSAGARAADAAKRLYEEAGGGAAYLNKPLARIYADLLVARNHPATAMYRDSARAIGMNLFGKEAEKRRRF
jgi:3-hydroxy-9,10-secoandrosta-1,3,5(10)-triene-9,17-dione monooxygenase